MANVFGFLREQAAISNPRWVEDKVAELLHDRYPMLMDEVEDQGFPTRTGYEFGVPAGGTAQIINRGAQRNRRQRLEELADVFEQCVWVSVSANAIARGVTGGGLKLVPDDAVQARNANVRPTGPEQRLARLLRRCNAREDIRQIIRSTVLDLSVVGDGYIEVGDVLGEPGALWSADAVTMNVDADEHGEIRGYYQEIDTQRRATFTPEQIIHVSLDSVRTGIYGKAPTDLALLPIVVWLYTMACAKEQMKAGNMPRLWADFPHGFNVKGWYERFMVRNRGAKNISTPILTRGSATVKELGQARFEEYRVALAEARDQILAAFAVPPHKAGVIEAGNLGSEGGAEAQDKTWRIDTIGPVQDLVAEKLDFRLVQQGFGITGKHLEFGNVDMRDSKVVEELRAIRQEHGVYTTNAWAADIGEPPVVGGDDAIMKTRTGVIRVADIPAAAVAQILGFAGQQAIVLTKGPDGTLNAEQGQPAHEEPDGDEGPDGSEPPGPEKPAPPKPGKKVDSADETMAKLRDSLAYQARRRRVLKELPRG